MRDEEEGEKCLQFHVVFIQAKAVVIFCHTVVDSTAPDGLCHSYDSCNMAETMTRSFPRKLLDFFPYIDV